jgi:hypothetical protein
VRAHPSAEGGLSLFCYGQPCLAEREPGWIGRLSSFKEWFMTGEVKPHDTSISMVKAAPAEVDVGTDIVLKVRVSCPSACDLQGKTVKIIAQDAVVVKEIELGIFNEVANETDEFVVSAPTKPGAYMWTAVFPAQEKDVVLHKESSTPFSFISKTHTTSMAVWDTPTPIVVNTKFKLKVGVKCSADCNLADQTIEIYDQEGGKVATEKLGGVPWSAARALYWAEVGLVAPGTEGLYSWTAKFPKPDLELPHKGSSHTFGFATVRQPEHVLTVEVIDKDTGTPIKKAYVMIHPYRGATDEHGVVRMRMPKGDYKLYVSKVNKLTFQTTVKVTGDIAIKAELLPEPPEEDDY